MRPPKKRPREPDDPAAQSIGKRFKSWVQSTLFGPKATSQSGTTIPTPSTASSNIEALSGKDTLCRPTATSQPESATSAPPDVAPTIDIVPLAAEKPPRQAPSQYDRKTTVNAARLLRASSCGLGRLPRELADMINKDVCATASY